MWRGYHPLSEQVVPSNYLEGSQDPADTEGKDEISADSDCSMSIEKVTCSGQDDEKYTA
jgi:hypothetical protein